MDAHAEEVGGEEDDEGEDVDAGVDDWRKSGLLKIKKRLRRVS